MTTAAGDSQIVPRPPTSSPALRAADRGVADALESVLSENTRRVYGAQWRIFTYWCADVGLRSLPANPPAPGRRPHRDVVAVIRLTAVQPRPRGRGFETPEQAAVRGKFDLALVAVLSDALEMTGDVGTLVDRLLRGFWAC